jgi:outer membrane lipoprotein carrier protein
MNLSKSIITTLIIGTFAVSASLVDLEKKGKDILDKVSKNYKGYKTVEASFSVSSENKAEKSKPVVEKGKIWIKGDKYKLEFDDQVILCNGKTIWTYFKLSKELTIENYDPKSAEIGPSTIFTFYQKGFKAKHDGEYMADKVKIDKVALNPVDKKKPYFNVTLHVKNTDNTIKQVEISYKNGVRQALEVKSQQANNPLDNKFFEYSASTYPATSTDDLR